jgi:mannose-6-phosphate isomerase-like protein (cupin superfamily)
MKTIRLNATGETMTFLKTTAETGGEYAEIIATLPEGCVGPPLHRHTRQSERFEVIEGELTVVTTEQAIVLQEGESCDLPPGITHRCFPTGGGAAKVRTVFRPALDIEWFLTEMFEACNRNDSADPSLVEAAYLFHAARAEYEFAEMPRVLQRVLFPALSVFGHAFGKIRVVPRSGGDTIAA